MEGIQISHDKIRRNGEVLEKENILKKIVKRREKKETEVFI